MWFACDSVHLLFTRLSFGGPGSKAVGMWGKKVWFACGSWVLFGRDCVCALVVC